jgi:hypothetical protein
MSLKPKAKPTPGKVLSVNDANNLNDLIANASVALGKLKTIANRQKQVIHYGPRCPHR